MTENSEIDLLSELLSVFYLRAQLYKHSTYCGEWEINTSGFKRATFHLIGHGDCWLHLKDRPEPVYLEHGDVVVFPHDAWHVLSPHRTLTVPSSQSEALPADRSTTILCGFFDFELSHLNPILQALPELVLVKGKQIGRFSSLETIIRLIEAEAESVQCGRQAVMDKLCEVFFVLVVRFYVATASDRRGVLAALSDTRLSRVLSAIHQKPGHLWTLEDLASRAGMSRTAFAVTFHQVVGMAPMKYLARWRMQQAVLMIKEKRLSVAEIAEQLGYETEAAFRRAFKRIQDVPPGYFKHSS